jgi:hypothetical protein
MQGEFIIREGFRPPPRRRRDVMAPCAAGLTASGRDEGRRETPRDKSIKVRYSCFYRFARFLAARRFGV